MHFTQSSSDPARLRATVRRAHAQYLKTGGIPLQKDGITWKVSTTSHLESTAQEVLQAALEIDNHPETWLKRSAINLVSATNLGNRTLVFKRYDMLGRRQQLHYRFRASRARRAWAAALTMRDFAISTPEPFALIEGFRGSRPIQSFYVHDFLKEAVTARQWIKPHLHRATPEVREQVRHELREMLLNLYRHGMYHGDTKTGNLLVTDTDDPERRTWSWIDLECVQVAVQPTRRRVMRNLVQLNGSVGSKIEEADRLAFLKDLSEDFPWMTGARVADTIRKRTMKRLRRELSKECGH